MQIWKGSQKIIKMIKRIFTLKIAFYNILSAQKYKKETKISKGEICVLGISKL